MSTKTLRNQPNKAPNSINNLQAPAVQPENSLFHQLDVRRSTRFVLIHIHSTYVNVTSTRLQDSATGADIGVTRAFYYSPNEFWVVEADQELSAPGNVNLILGFEGSLVRGIVGIYKSTYVNTKTKEPRHVVDVVSFRFCIRIPKFLSGFLNKQSTNLFFCCHYFFLFYISFPIHDFITHYCKSTYVKAKTKEPRHVVDVSFRFCIIIPEFLSGFF